MAIVQRDGLHTMQLRKRLHDFHFSYNEWLMSQEGTALSELQSDLELLNV